MAFRRASSVDMLSFVFMFEMFYELCQALANTVEARRECVGIGVEDIGDIVQRAFLGVVEVEEQLVVGRELVGSIVLHGCR